MGNPDVVGDADVTYTRRAMPPYDMMRGTSPMLRQMMVAMTRPRFLGFCSSTMVRMPPTRRTSRWRS